MTPQFQTDVNKTSPSTEIGLNVQDSTPPVQAYLGKDDTLWIMTASAFPNIVVTVSARLLMPDGTIKPNQWSFAAQNLRNGFFTPIVMPECFILSLSITANVAQASRGFFGQAIISRGLPTLGVAAQVLCSGYITSSMPISWPSGVSTNSLDTRGNIRSILNGAGAAGGELSITVPTNALWRPVSVLVFFSTSAAVANRTPSLIFDDGANAFAQMENQVIVTASQTVGCMWAADMSNKSAISQVSNMGMPGPIYLPNFFRIRTFTFGIQGGDQYTSSQLLVEEWLLP